MLRRLPRQYDRLALGAQLRASPIVTSCHVVGGPWRCYFSIGFCCGIPTGVSVVSGPRLKRVHPGVSRQNPLSRTAAHDHAHDTLRTILRRFQAGKIEVQTLLTRTQPNDAENGDALGVRLRKGGAPGSKAASIPIEDLNAENDE